jgi:hypothetical protein
MSLAGSQRTKLGSSINPAAAEVDTTPKQAQKSYRRLGGVLISVPRGLWD